MSDEDDITQVDGIEPPSGGSLDARMQQRAERLSKQTAETFDIPGFEGVLLVELKALNYRTIRKVQQRNEKVRPQDTQEIYNMADQLVLATTGFYEVPEGGGDPVKITDDWIRLARRMPNCPDSPTPRMALLHLIKETRIHFLVEEWGRWARAVRGDQDEEVREDFAVTGSAH